MRARNLIFIITISLLISACAREKGPRHKIAEDEKEILMISLAPGGKHEFTIKADAPLRLSLSTDASFEAMKKFSSADPLPVRLEHQSKKQWVSTVKGAGHTTFTPVDGVVPLRLTNDTDENLRILVYSSRD